MTTFNPSPLPIDKDLLRQREIAVQAEALRAPVATVRAAAARRLGDMKAGLDELLSALRDAHETVRAAAAMALGSFSGDPREPVIIDDLMAAIDDSSEKVCQSAIRSLGMLRAHAAQAEIEEFLEDANTHIAGAAVLALARISAGDEHERQPAGRQLAGYLSHPSTYVRMQAARAVAILKYQPAGPRIAQMIQQTRAERAAKQAEAAPGEPGREAIAQREPGEDEHYALLNQLVRAAAALRLKEAIPSLLEIARKDIGLRGLAVEALVAAGAEVAPDLLSTLLHDPSAFLRRRLILMMAQANYQPALPLLRPLLFDENVTTRGAALQALTMMDDRQSIPQVEWVAFHDSNPFLRLQAVHSLAALLGPLSRPRMLALAADPNYEVRRAAVDHLMVWGAEDQASSLALARFARDFTGDEYAQSITERLRLQGVDPLQLDIPDEPPPEPVLPASLRPVSAQLLDLLERWQQSLTPGSDTPGTPPPSLQSQRAQLALGYLIDLLKGDCAS